MSDKSLIGRKVRKLISKSERCKFNSAISWFLFIFQNILSPQNLVAVAYNNRPHYYFGKVVEEEKGEAVKISFLRQLSINKYCWPNEPVIESVKVEQIFQRNIKAEVLEESNTFAFPVMQDITAKFSQCRGQLEMANKKAVVCTRDSFL